MEKTRLLFVDDERSIRVTLPLILEMHGFSVKTAGSVTEALNLIQAERFDVLLSDLNIGQPGDGFTVVSAMRRVQPEAITIILTGYPAFETALQAIRNQVDDYLVKPAQTEDLIAMIKRRIDSKDPHVPPPLRKLSFVIEDAREQLMDSYVDTLKRDDRFPTQGLSREEIMDDLPQVLEDLVYMLREGRERDPKASMESARNHGRVRSRQGFTLIQLVLEIHVLRALIQNSVQNNLLNVDLSSMVPDMTRISGHLDGALVEAITVFTGPRSEQLRTA